MKKIAIIAGASALMLAAAAYAAPIAGKMKMDADGNGSVTKAEAASGSDARFAKMDADGNGQVDQADKIARVKARFAKMDSDNNGAVTEAEFIAADAARKEMRMQRKGDGGEGRGGPHGRGDRGHGGGHGGGRDGGVGKWGQADTNGDKAISRAEYDAAQQARFAAKDINNDGVISAEETKNARQEMRGKWRAKREAAANAG